MRTPLRMVLSVLTVLFVATAASPALALAAQPQLDSGAQISTDKPYDNDQVISNVFDNPAIYGKLEGTTPIDIYKFTAEKDGDQTISLLLRPDEVGTDTQPYLILLDPTSATESASLGLPMPSDKYHSAVLSQIQGGRSFSEPVLLQKFSVYAEQRVKLQKGQVYYVMILDAARQADHYVLKFGDGKVWSFTDFFKHFSTWTRIKVDAYAGSSPFSFPAAAVGLLLFLIGMSLLIGTWVLQETFNFLSNRSKAAGYLLVKMQPFSRYFIWISLWFSWLGGYMFFSHSSFTGLPFLIAILGFPITAVMLVLTIVLSPRLMQVEVSHKEAAIPLKLRRSLFATFVLNLIFIASFVTFLTMYLAHKA